MWWNNPILLIIFVLWILFWGFGSILFIADYITQLKNKDIEDFPFKHPDS